MIRWARFWLVLAALLCWGVSLRAQAVRVEGGEEYRAAELVRDLLRRNNYRLIERDTVLPKEFRTAGDLLILDADVRLEGEVTGAVGVVRGTFFVRPGARVVGPIATIGGGVYPSGLAQIGEVVQAPPEADVSFVPENGTLRVQVTPPRPQYLVFPGALGLGAPEYNRVDGLALSWGPQWHISGRADGPRFAPYVTYHSARGEIGGGVGLDLPLGGGVRATAEITRATFTNEEWIRGDLPNTLAALSVASDLRNYYQSDRITLTLAGTEPDLLTEDQFAVVPRLALLASRDRSLRARDPWALFSGDWRPNPPVDSGTMVSVAAGAELLWEGTSTTLGGEIFVERALDGPGDFAFTQWTAAGLWAMNALWNHQISVHGRAMGTLGDENAPPQRWSFVGGINTLATLDVAELRGDNLVFLQSTYGVPLPALALPLLGPPTLEAVHAIGTAWVTGSDAPAWEQNLGIGLRFALFTVHAYADPAGDRDPVLAAGLSLPSF